MTGVFSNYMETAIRNCLHIIQLNYKPLLVALLIIVPIILVVMRRKPPKM